MQRVGSRRQTGSVKGREEIMQKWEYGVILGFTGLPGYLKNANEAATDFRTYKPCFYRLTAQGGEMVTDFSKKAKGSF